MKKRKKRIITGSLVLVIVVTVVINHITGGLISTSWRWAKEQIRPPKLQLSLTKCIIYRTDFEHFPNCEMGIVANNPSSKDLTVNLRLLRLFREDIVYRFPAGEGILRVGGRDLVVKNFQFKARVLDEALRVPQDSNTAMIKLTWDYVERNSSDSLILGDADVVKCTYWQQPVFESEAEADSIGAILLGVRGPLHFSDTLTGKQGQIYLDTKVFTNRDGLLDFDMTQFMSRVFEKDVSWGLYLPSFRRRYGGIYLGLLASDTGNVEQLLSPSHFFNDIGDYDEFDLIGATFEEDFSSIIEFIYYTLDPPDEQQLFRLYHENSRYFVLMVYEERQDVESMITRLMTKGYRVGAASTRRFGFLRDALMLITPTEKLASFAQEFNAYVDSLNLVTKTNGTFIFFPVPLASGQMNRITKDISEATGKSYAVTFSFDCRPFKSRLPQAPFSTPVLVFLNFSDETVDGRVDSITVKYPIRP